MGQDALTLKGVAPSSRGSAWRSAALRRFSALAACLFVIQLVVLLHLVRVADEEFTQRLYLDTAPNLSNSIVLQAQREGDIRTAFRAGAARFRSLYPTAAVLLIDSSGAIRESVPPTAPGPVFELDTLALIAGESMPTLPVRLVSGQLPSRVFSAAKLRYGEETFLLVIVPELRVMQLGIPGMFKFFSWAIVFGIVPWIAAFCGFAALLAWIARSLRRTTVAIRERRSRALPDQVAPLAHELAELRFAVATQQSELERLADDTSAIEAGGRSLLPRLLHDLQTPYSVICGYCELLTGRGEKAAYQLTQLKIGLDRVSGFIETLRDFVRRSGSGLEASFGEVDLGSLLNEVVASFSAIASMKGVKLDVESSQLIIQGDRPLLTRAISNLLDNAIKFTPAGGVVKVHARPDADGVEVSVRDTGPGIAAEYLPRLGEEFFRVADTAEAYGEDPGGSGLGLANVRDLLKAHGAELRIESELGAGSVFSFLLPHHKEMGAKAVATEKQPVGERGWECLLLLTGYALIGGVSRRYFGSSAELAPYELCFAVTCFCALLFGQRSRLAPVLLLSLLSVMAALILRDGEVKNLVRDALFGIYHLTAGSLVFARLRNPWLRVATFVPMVVVIAGFEFAAGPRVISALLVVGIVAHLTLLRAGDLSVSRRLARRSALGVFSLLLVTAVPGVYFLARGFETAQLAQSRVALGTQLRAPFFDALLLAPDLSAEHTSLVGPSERVRKLANRMIQPSLFAGALAMVPCGLLLALFAGETIQRGVSVRLQRLSEACRSSAPDVAIASWLAEGGGGDDELRELGESLLRVYVDVASTVRERERAIERRSEMVGRLVKELAPVVEANRKVVERLEKLEEPTVLAAEAGSFLADLRRQAAAIGSFFQISKLTPIVGARDLTDSDGVIDTVMDVTGKVPRVEVDGIAEVGSTLAISPENLRQLLQHGIGAARSSSAEGVIVGFDGTSFEIRRTEELGALESSLENYVRELHLDRLTLLLTLVGGHVERRGDRLVLHLPVNPVATVAS